MAFQPNGSPAFSIGRDCTVVIVHPLAPGGRVDIPNVTGFMSRQVTASVKMDRLDGLNITAELPKGWSGEVDFDRGNSGADDLIAAIEAAWYNGGAMGVGTLYEYISEPTGGTSTYQYDNVALKFDPGAWRGDAIVKQKLSFEASHRIKV